MKQEYIQDSGLGKGRFSLFNQLLKANSGVLLLSNRYLGILISLVFLINPSVAMGAGCSLAGAFLFSKQLGREQLIYSLPAYLYNPILVGGAIGFFGAIDLKTAIMASVFGAAAFMLTLALSDILFKLAFLPVLTLPFLILTVVYINQLPAENMLLNLDLVPGFEWMNGFFSPMIEQFFKTIGALFFMPSVFYGLLLAASIFMISRIVFFLAGIGYWTGYQVEFMLTGNPVSHVNHLNSILIAVAIGGVFLIPSKKNYLIALVSVIFSVVLQIALSGIPIFERGQGLPITFNIIVPMVLYTLRISEYNGLTPFFKETPEENLDHYLLTRDRIPTGVIQLFLPFSGAWTVYQGFDGQWTHREKWRHAYDFVISDADGKHYRNQGNHLGDFYAYGKPVLSPVNGTVVRVLTELPDNPIGKPDKINNWGNYIIIKNDSGFYTEISHFAFRSIRVNVGDRVQIGDILGLCGNSGYSFEPHIHIQVQHSDLPGDSTIPFHFSTYVEGDCFRNQGLPADNTLVENLLTRNAPKILSEWLLDRSYRLYIYRRSQEIKDKVEVQGKKIGHVRLKSTMRDNGSGIIESEKGGLYFSVGNGIYQNYGYYGKDPCMKMIAAALPIYPLNRTKQIRWNVDMPAGYIYHGLKKMLLQFVTPFASGMERCGSVQLAFNGSRRISGKINRRFLSKPINVDIELDHQFLIEKLVIGDRILVKETGDGFEINK